MYIKLQRNMIQGTTNFINHFLKNYKPDFTEILEAYLYYINASLIQKSDRFDAWIIRYKKNGCR